MEALAGALVDVLGADYAGVHLPILPLGVLLENVAGLYPTLLAGGVYHAASLEETGFANPFRPDFARLAGAVAATGAKTIKKVAFTTVAVTPAETFQKVYAVTISTPDKTVQKVSTTPSETVSLAISLEAVSIASKVKTACC